MRRNDQARPCALAVGLVLSLLGTATASPQPIDPKPTVPASDFGRWERLRTPTLSPAGDAFAYLTERVDGDRKLTIRRLEPEETWEIPWGTEPVFSVDGRFLVWKVTPSKEEQEKLEKDDKPIRNRGELLEPATGERRELGEVSELELGPNGRFLAVQGPADEAEPEVSDLHVHDFSGGTTTIFGNVESFAWHEERPLLAMIVSSGGERGNAVQVFAPETGRLRGLDHSTETYRHLAWHEDAGDLAVLRSRTNEKTEEEESDAAEEEEEGIDATEYELLAWTGVAESTGGLEPQRLDEGAEGLGSEFYVTGDAEPVWSTDGARLAIGVRQREDEEDGAEPAEADGEQDVETEDNETEDESEDNETEDVETEDLAGVQIWHTSDVRIVPMQKAFEEEDRKRTLLAVWDREAGRVVRVGTDLRRDAEFLARGSHAIETDEIPYPWGTMFGRPYLDVWTVDLATGQRRKSLEKVRHWWPSVEGRHLLWFDGEHYWSLELASGQRTNLTAGVPTRFADLDRDLPNGGLEPPFGVAGWLADDEAVLLYSEFDVWRIAPDGSSAVRLTEGAEDETKHRLQDLDDEEEAFSAAEGLYFSVRNEWTEKRGFARWTEAEGYRRLVFEDKSFWDLEKAKSADALLYRRESRTDAPDLFLTDSSFSSPRLVAESNPFLDDYAWTRAELIEYRNAEDRRLQGVLLYPANHDRDRKYPMIVHAYEILSPWIHVWEPPDEKDYYNPTAWTQRGYFVLLPDVHFRAGDPGVSLAETLSAAIDKVDATGLIDRAKVGFAGHSWGGYEATYLAARTDLFAATVAGAPLTDFVSFMGQIHWRPGVPESDHWETGQARMAVPYWEDPEGHHRNSPLHGVHEMTTPILMAHGDEDGVVEFFQSTLFYNFARRAAKQMVLLVYEGEGHGIRREENQTDYHRRILEWFDHYLKGEPAPQWVTAGIRWQDHEDEKRRLVGTVVGSSKEDSAEDP